MTTSREIVRSAIHFCSHYRVPRSLSDEYGGSDFVDIAMSPHPDRRPRQSGVSVDEWNCVWENIGICKLGEVKVAPLAEATDWQNHLTIPDVTAPERWIEPAARASEAQKDGKYIIASGIALYERLHFLRGMENLWMDIYLNPDELREMIAMLVKMNLEAIERYAACGADGYMFCDDWGLQDRLMIAPESWREFWKPAYKEVYEACHKHGMDTILHSCGYIVDILDDLIECGLDVIQMDQQQNMTLDLLSERFRGRIAFWCPVDIQNMMIKGSCEEIKAYAREMFEKLATDHGGFLSGYYADPVGSGHKVEAIQAMAEVFTQLHYKSN